MELPNRRIFNNAFKERGIDNVVKIEALPVEHESALKLIFESASSRWRQGVWIKTDLGLVINHQECPSANLWMDSAPREVIITCRTSNNLLYIYNIWDKGSGRESQTWTSGMLVEEMPRGRRYRCNDIGFDTDFDKLVFRIEHV